MVEGTPDNTDKPGAHIPFVGAGRGVVITFDFCFDVAVSAGPVLARIGVSAPRLRVVRHTVNTVTQGSLYTNAGRPIPLCVVSGIRTRVKVTAAEAGPGRRKTSCCVRINNVLQLSLRTDVSRRRFRRVIRWIEQEIDIVTAALEPPSLRSRRDEHSGDRCENALLQFISSHSAPPLHFNQCGV
ncbi:hypothetical protein SS05631_c13000 [Sinorhizobium sp. CCBAU 05631]|nr:hypothetical protein SS05631_c13000 [Sinorhizobium sp. CCBAU 05631]